jgi:hypothetical protein
MKSLLDPTFTYTPSYGTNLAKTFAAIKRRQRQAEKERANVLPMRDRISPGKRAVTSNA